MSDDDWELVTNRIAALLEDVRLGTKLHRFLFAEEKAAKFVGQLRAELDERAQVTAV